MRVLKALLLIVIMLLASAHLVMGISLLAAKQTGHQLIVVTGGSMAPTFKVGDAILVGADKSKLKEKDIITYGSNQGLTTHRLVSFHKVEGQDFVRTKGDANAEEDPDLVPLANVVGSVKSSYPKLGYVMNFIASKEGLVLTLLPILLFVLFSEGKTALSIWREDEYKGKRRKTKELDYEAV